MSHLLQGNGKGKSRDYQSNIFLQPSPAAQNVSPSIPGGGGPLGSSVGMSPPTGRNNTHRVPEPASPGFDDRRGQFGGLGNIPLPLKMRQESTRATDRTDALWAEMQATLEEVELSASGGTRVFGPDHDRKLAELRAAQIALAQAWARSEADEAIEDNVHQRQQRGGASSKLGGEGSATAAETERLGAKMEEETELDILLARKRREANDRYFSRVNQGVLDVVAKLDEVARAMREVEQESKDIWDGGEGDHDNDHDQTSVASQRT
ncbi:hypothetical protein MCOR27_006110 [Pyricularia oryzae]|uniref:Uncharacterized protein n=4 Tax=Pyricularia TaxID=48558 RepID=A0ABQ8N5V4_PYRGI|nr:uncharacterized protein MGG_01065 [Pyricularia oryzae 70-15]ELQ39511.1 hypothetical protein OOU_Y34scaffold00496g47 [Pyricularia oryzae Y34]KAH8840267.1 hypothetical protein MCOR01_006986 [Pyricularia oryzae]KAI6291794.1 hypothetical protein MCOR33_010340 [Pyricularia grisea]EHA48290.1 hypothetical protein MGG_01065 [Pyricularia oryzae 70-15]KAI6260735.1 hypothetical protein MCOR19_002952 [Pyricularia oryzae]